MEGQRSSLLVVGTELIQFHAAQDIKRQYDLKKRMNKITDTWRNGYLAEWMIIGFPPHTTTITINIININACICILHRLSKI